MSEQSSSSLEELDGMDRSNEEGKWYSKFIYKYVDYDHSVECSPEKDCLR